VSPEKTEKTQLGGWEGEGHDTWLRSVYARKVGEGRVVRSTNEMEGMKRYSRLVLRDREQGARRKGQGGGVNSNLAVERGENENVPQ